MPSKTTEVPDAFDRSMIFVEIVFHALRREAAQAVVAAELEDDQVRRKVTQSRIDTGSAPFGRFTADAGVHDAMFVP